LGIPVSNELAASLVDSVTFAVLVQALECQHGTKGSVGCTFLGPENFDGTSSNISKKVLGPTKAQENKLELAKAGLHAAKSAVAKPQKLSKGIGCQSSSCQIGC
jgi:hypothetical protein